MGVSFSAANATVINGATTGISDPDTLITFDEVSVPNGTVITDQYESLGVTFSPNAFALSNVSARPNVSGPVLINFGGGQFVNPFSINFVDDVTAASFTLTTGPNRTTLFEALSDGVVIQMFSAATNATAATNIYGFFGFAFDEIRVTIGAANSNNGTVIDNLAFVSEVPLPAALPLFLAGLAGLGLARKNKTV